MEARIMSGMEHHLAVQRYVDGELRGAVLAEFEARLLRDAALRAAVDESRALRAVLASAAASDAAAPAGFASRVLDEVRRLPSRAELATEATGERQDLTHVVAMARRLFVAAVLIGGVALLIWAGLLRRADSARVEASDRKAMVELQQRIEQERRLREAGPAVETQRR
jgi:hypothetical protein